MSLRDVISVELARKLAGLSVDDFMNVARAGSLGLGPADLRTGVQALANGEEFNLPSGGGRPNPLVIQAWSFAKDHGQFHDAYGLSSAQAGELVDLLRTDVDKGVAEITRIVTTKLRQRGSPRPVIVNTAGIPGAPTTDHSVSHNGGVSRSALKAEIKKDGATYGLYKFVVEDTGRSGNFHFRVRLGGGLYAIHPSKQGAIDVARICRLKGRRHELIEGHIVFWLEGRSPLSGADIPEKVTFDGRLAPNATPPADPSQKAKTSAGGNGSSSTREKGKEVRIEEREEDEDE